MKYWRYLITLIFVFITRGLYPQDASFSNQVENASKLVPHTIHYVTVAIALLVLLALAYFLFRIEKKIAQKERESF